VPVSRACACVSALARVGPPSSRRKLARLIIPVRSAGLARVRVCLGVGTRWALAIAAGTGFR